ncbi:GerMN domain-containing protein [Mobilitalea sibirica]|uniref:GerMN domain-containing protein n=1 Tax=Mobilitalea sibirica TaxID=1462919 RepID=A0A8J7GZH0_9FIRM|nr:GerMN domain-containing protein [Mobilitalea sibirica]MBH1941274.1 GerMN domain-containing protein [Mobilitalea sibirica]
MKKQIYVLLLLLIIVFFSGCSNDKDNNQGEEVKVYYIDSKTSTLVSENYTPIETEKKLIVEELLSALRKEPKNVVYKKALPDKVTIKDLSIKADELTINFDSTYNELVGIPEVLCRAAIVRTLTQIDGLKYVVFNVSDQQFVDSNGLSLFTKEDFIESTSAETNYKVSLYFADATGQALVDTVTNIFYTGTGSIEELVIKQLINGPTQPGMLNTVPEGTTLLNVTTKEGICVVDFNEKFNDSLPNVSKEISIYSVVNSLVELPGINKVQFKINGTVGETYERNLSLVKGEE